jgi:glycine dehydrogenase subunit 2
MTSKKVRRFHQASWDEPIIFGLSVPGQRGLMAPAAEDEVVDRVGDRLSEPPSRMRRAEAPALPEMGQLQVLRQFNHLSQENIGVDGNIDIGQGTCTMKYSPKIND